MTAKSKFLDTLEKIVREADILQGTIEFVRLHADNAPGDTLCDTMYTVQQAAQNLAVDLIDFESYATRAMNAIEPHGDSIAPEFYSAEVSEYCIRRMSLVSLPL